MAFHHRKLLNASAIDPSETEFCSPFCDEDKNSDGICPFNCINLCYPVCNTPLPQSLPPQPLLPPPSTVVVYTDPPNKPQKLSLLLTVSLAVLATAFFIFTCYTIYKLYSSWYNSRRRRLDRRGPDQEPGSDEFLDEDHEPVVDHHVWYIRTVGLQPSVISKITIVKYKKGDGLIEGTDCSVCLSEFEEDETLRLLPKCNHAFHIPCIDTWLRSHTNCPLCRAGIVKNPSDELIVHDSGLVAEAGVGNSVSHREAENRASEIRIGIEEDNESRAGIGLKTNDDGIQAMRRSVSLDSLSAATINAAIADAFPGRNSDDQSVEANVVTNQSPSNEISSQTGPCSIKRSFSCSAKVFVSRYNHSSRSRNSRG